MPSISLKHIRVSIPVFEDGASRSLRAILAAPAVGAFIKRDIGRVTVINALEDLSLELAKGDVCGLIGHNGAGKTTLLRVLSGAYVPDRGSVEINGKVMTLLNISLGMDPEISGYENIFIRGIMMGVDQKTIKAQLNDIIEFTGLGDYIHLPVRTYSSGMGLRLMFAISTSFDSDILLVDEVIGVGDATFYNKAAARLEERINKAGIAVIASHSIDILKRFCNKAVWMDHGKIMKFGPLEEVSKAYLESQNNA